MPSCHMTLEQQMRCIQDTLYVISGKWKIPIVRAIYEGNSRFREIQRTVTGITSKVLSKELRELEQNKLIVRSVYETLPVRVEYTATPYCNSLQTMIEEMIEWGKNHLDKIKTE